METLTLITGYTTTISITTTVFYENDDSTTTAQRSPTSVNTQNTVQFSTDEWNVTLGKITTTESIVNNVSLSLAILCSMSFLLSATVVSLLIAVAFRNYRLRRLHRDLPEPPAIDYQSEFEMDSVLGGVTSIINNAYSPQDTERLGL